MRVLVTGASGMLGASVATALRDRGDDVSVAQRRPSGLNVPDLRVDVTSPAEVHGAVAGHDAVIHLAAKVDVTGSWTDYLRVNVEGTANVVAACRAAGVGRLVFVSSPSVAHSGRPLVGAGAGPADPERARGSYARSKALAEQLALAASDDALSVVAVRPHLVWGPGDTQLVARIVARARAGRLALVGSGAALIDTTYVSNAADALVAALDACPRLSGDALVVSNGEPRPVADIVSRVCIAAGVRPPFVRVPRWAAWGVGALAEGAWALLSPGGVPPMTRFLVEQLTTAHWFEQRRTREALQWEPAVSLEDGFRRLEAWYAAEPLPTGG